MHEMDPSSHFLRRSDKQLLYRMTQGDLEKSLGWTPVPLFDRDRAADLPVMQVVSYNLVIVILWSCWSCEGEDKLNYKRSILYICCVSCHILCIYKKNPKYKLIRKEEATKFVPGWFLWRDLLALL